MARVRQERESRAKIVCPECGASRLMNDSDQGELVCMNCGYVIDDKITDFGPEWRAFDDEQKTKRTRVGAPLTYTIHDKGLSTLIDWHDKSFISKDTSLAQTTQVFTLRKWQRRVRVADAAERNLASALSEMSKISSALNLPKNILETAAVLYRKAVKRKLIRGRSIQGVAAAAIYMSCRKCNIPRTLDEIAQATSVSKKEIGRCYRFLAKELDEFVPPILPTRYISKISNHLFMKGKAEMVAASILDVAGSLRLTSGRGPTGIAAAATYIASVLAGEKKTQREVAMAANVTEVTIRNRYRELMDKIEIIVKL
ncbi:transcription initiation factor IIB [Candidatus Bathyarchaeota archaeon]|nr:MAG: transcription initiation factor IIB [Candidatus Hecatellales archaeon]RLI34096.1 MAG: transcription initiation factor IIB [Candidatus Bathyarchaeota archaeon]